MSKMPSLQEVLGPRPDESDEDIDIEAEKREEDNPWDEQSYEDFSDSDDDKDVVVRKSPII